VIATLVLHVLDVHHKLCVPLFNILYEHNAVFSDNVSASAIVTVKLPLKYVPAPGAVIVVVGSVLSCVLLVLALQLVVFHKVSLALTK